MPTQDQLLQQLMPIFAAEAQEHLAVLNRDLLALEKQPSEQEKQQLLAEIFRAAHSLKGSAGAVKLDDVSHLAHSMESLFRRVQRGDFELRVEWFDKVYHALDVMSALVQQTPNAQALQMEVPALSAELEAIGEQPDFAPAETPTPPANGQSNGQDTLPPPLEVAPPHQDTAIAAAPTIVPAEPPPALQEPAPHHSVTDETVRVAISKLDSLLEQVGELQVTRIAANQRLVQVRELTNQIEAWEAEGRKLRASSTFRRYQAAHAQNLDAPVPEELVAFWQANENRLREARAVLADLQRALGEDSRRMAQVTADLQDGVRRTRMMPASTLFDTYPRMVRDLARELGKEVQLVIEGGETELDRAILEQISAPLLHLLRNAVDHGIESPAARGAAGKPRQGTITLRAAQRGGSIVIEIIDDGAGIDVARVRVSAVQKGVVSAEQANALNDQDALWLIFRSGMSTRTTITDISGRGVGLDVVRENVERLQGVIEIENHVGQGTRFTCTLPLTVATMLCLLAQVGSETFALPILNVARITRVANEEIGHAQGRETISVDGRPVVLMRLADLLGITAPSVRTNGLKKPVLILGAADKRLAFSVDALLGTQEIVLKALPAPLRHVQHIAGATILGTGEVVMVLNVAELLRTATGAPISAATPTVTEPVAVPTILIADDSITTRTLEKNILEAAGYQVRAASDGMEAFEILQAGGIDLLVSDVNMPRVDGFELTEKVRADQRFKNLPVILVTSLASREDRERGISAGADAYIVKGAFDQDTLLATIRQLI